MVNQQCNHIMLGLSSWFFRHSFAEIFLDSRAPRHFSCGKFFPSRDFLVFTRLWPSAMMAAVSSAGAFQTGLQRVHREPHRRTCISLPIPRWSSRGLHFPGVAGSLQRLCRRRLGQISGRIGSRQPGSAIFLRHLRIPDHKSSAQRIPAKRHSFDSEVLHTPFL